MALPPLDKEPGWLRLRGATPARIGLSRAGSAIATRDHLAFQRAHAEARDAVHASFDPAPILDALHERGFETAFLKSAAEDRRIYLLRPDLGRRLDAVSRDRLAGFHREEANDRHDLVLVLSDGLSAQAVTRHAIPLLDAAMPAFRQRNWRIGPVVLVERGRVAIGDEIGRALGTAMVAMLIGERPGLTSPDSLGVYLTWAPTPGRTDAERNCLSNIRPEGMSYAEAAERLFHLCNEARRRMLTGVALKDETVLATAEPKPLLSP